MISSNQIPTERVESIKQILNVQTREQILYNINALVAAPAGGGEISNPIV